MQIKDLYDFSWRVHSRYALSEATATDAVAGDVALPASVETTPRDLVVCEVPVNWRTGGRPPWRVYRPFRTATALFVEFTEIEPTQQGVLLFANRYGLLGIGDEPPTDDGQAGEPISAWQANITMMRLAVQVWFGLIDANDGPLRTLQEQTRIFTEPGGLAFAAEHGLREYYLDPPRLDRHRLRAIASEWLTCALNEQLAEASSPRMLSAAGRLQFRMVLHPTSLLGAMWIQFAKAVEESQELRRCHHCHRPFVVAKATRKFCSDACKTRTLRHKMDEAVRLANEGVSTAEIATRLATTTELAEKWQRHTHPSGRSLRRTRRRRLY